MIMNFNSNDSTVSQSCRNTRLIKYSCVCYYLSTEVLCRCCCCRWVASFVSSSLRPHRRQPTRLPHPWDSPGKNTGVGCHFLFQCMKLKSENEVALSCLTYSDPMDYIAHQAPPSMGFSGKSTGVGPPLPSPTEVL